MLLTCFGLHFLRAPSGEVGPLFAVSVLQSLSRSEGPNMIESNRVKIYYCQYSREFREFPTKIYEILEEKVKTDFAILQIDQHRM
jgi:hypothetical protein